MLRFLVRTAIFLGSSAIGLPGRGVAGACVTVRPLGSSVAATVVVWLVTALATLLLPILVLKKKVT